jgi:hypothetical protein
MRLLKIPASAAARPSDADERMAVVTLQVQGQVERSDDAS